MSKFVVRKIQIGLNLTLKATAVLKKTSYSSTLQLQERVQQLLGILTPFDFFALVNTDSLNTKDTFINLLIILKKANHLKWSWTLAN